eukprot:TRINITY_DN7551_c0_g1_i2.p2 TRINITY_DN7551_c0_g1~~TRINITY_DN7551_c0_g1_i2.p2  ORF type:complete len:215 (+),score=40.26 TRINITY_DN7551_c0_g1_i2:1646-2290(+)
MEFQYSKDGKELDEYYADLRRQHEADCQAYNKPSDCHALGEFYETVDKNFAKAAEVFHGLCNRKYGRSCYRLGSMHMAGRGVDQDVKAAFDHFEKACEYGNVEGCHNVGMILRSKNAAGIAQDGPRALSLFQSACDKDFRNGCFMASVMLLKGEAGVAKDGPRALALATKACDLNHTWGCVNAARMLAIGDGVPKDEKRSQEFKDRAKALAESS